MELVKHWKTVLETMNDGLMFIDPAGVIQDLNPAAEKLTGYTREEIVGKKCTVLDCTGCAVIGKGEGPDWCRLYTEERIRAHRCLITSKTGRPIHVLKHASVLRDDKGEIIGAVESLTDITEVMEKEREISTLRRSLRGADGFHGILGNSEAILRLTGLIANVAASDAPVLIRGESGTGKELVARAIHRVGPRADKPFIKVNCAALNENLLESELFGHVKGAFTGADRNRIGRFEAASGGTIFLDEIGDIPLATQVKLLRVLEEKEIERVGDHRPIPVDVRIITATNRHLEDSIARGEFREDLFYRINVVPLEVPPLRERMEDLPILVSAFIDKVAAKSGKSIHGVAADAMDCLLKHTWPGNIRELQNAIEYAFVLCPEGLIRPEHLPGKVASPEDCRTKGKAAGYDPSFVSERERLIQVLRQAGHNQSEAARILGVSRVTIWKRMKKYGINLERDVG